jgi:hypothetical protein
MLFVTFSGPFSKWMDEKPFVPLGAGKNGGIKLVLDAHTLTNFVSDFKKGR